jgi:hypothetical protein
LPLSVSPRSPAAISLVEDWSRLRGQRLMPRRSDLDPATLKPILPYMNILEVRARDQLIYRLAGTAIRDMIGTELTGRNLLDLTGPNDRRVRSWRCWNAATRPCGCHYNINLAYPGGATNLHEGLLLPIEPDRPGAPPLLLGLFGPHRGSHWINEDGGAPIDLPAFFTFFDIGAGTPDADDPPEGYHLTD